MVMMMMMKKVEKKMEKKMEERMEKMMMMMKKKKQKILERSKRKKMLKMMMMTFLGNRMRTTSKPRLLASFVLHSCLPPNSPANKTSLKLQEGECSRREVGLRVVDIVIPYRLAQFHQPGTITLALDPEAL
jgi:hypothetical protein